MKPLQVRPYCVYLGFSYSRTPAFELSLFCTFHETTLLLADERTAPESGVLTSYCLEFAV